MIAWATGGRPATLLRGARDTGIDIPMVTSTGNLSANFFKQYGSVLPSNLVIAAVPYYLGETQMAGPTKTAVTTMTGR